MIKSKSQNNIQKATKLFRLQRCPDCHAQLQNHANTKYCPICQKCPVLFDTTPAAHNFSVSSTPNFKTSYPENRAASSKIKIQSYLNDLLCKLNVKLTSSEMDSVREKVKYIHMKRGVKCKGYRQQTAVLLYCTFQHQFRMSVYQFCQKTGLNRKKFNKMYLIYMRMLNESTNGGSQRASHQFDDFQHRLNQGIKLQVKKQELSDGIYQQQQQQQLQQQKYEKQQQQLNDKNQKEKVQLIQKQQNQQHKPVSKLTIQQNLQQIDSNHDNVRDDLFPYGQQLQSIKSTLQSLYPHIFTSSYLVRHKTQIFSSLCQKTLELCRIFYQFQPNNFVSTKKYFRIPAALFCIIKMNNFKITVKIYIALVQKVLNVKITQRMISKFINIYKKQLVPVGNVSHSNQTMMGDEQISYTIIQNKIDSSQKNSGSSGSSIDNDNQSQSKKSQSLNSSILSK